MQQTYLRGLVSGLLLALAPLAVQAQSTSAPSTIALGYLERTGTAADALEFNSVADTAQADVLQRDLAGIRPWMGISPVSPGPKRQRLYVSRAQPGQVYTFTIYPAYVTGYATYRAALVQGTGAVADGATKPFASPGAGATKDPWRITVVPDSTSFTLELSNPSTSGANYLYFDAIRVNIQPLPWGTVKDFVRKVKELDTPNGGTWSSGQIINAEGHYQWTEGYVLDAYVTMYRVTKDAYWLGKVVDHSERLMAQRDIKTGVRDYRNRLAPGWQERSSRYAWLGFSAHLLAPMLEFSYLVATTPALKSLKAADGQTYATKAENYADVADAVFAFHAQDWVYTAGNKSTPSTAEGYFQFPKDIPVPGGKPLAGRPMAYNMGAMAASAQLELSRYRAATGKVNEAVDARNKAAAYARYFKNSVLKCIPWGATSYYLWQYSAYYSGAEDVGHANVTIAFVVRCAAQNLVYNRTDLLRFANTFDRILADDNTVPDNRIDGTTHSTMSRSLMAWFELVPYRASLTRKANGYLHHQNYPFVALVTYGALRLGTLVP
jgi:hypothetical protein